MAPAAGEHRVVRFLGAAAFVLLAVALCARAVLDEDRTVPVAHLLRPPEERLLLGLGASLMPRYLSHLLAAGGIGLAVLWVTLSRHRWRWGSLETAALILIAAALLSVPVASDKRLALNTAADTILPLITAATLYQLLVRRAVWRRALLAGLVAVAAANSWKAASQRYWEYTEHWDAYQRSQAAFWSQRGIRLDDSSVAVRWAAKRSMRPRGFIQGINALSSFLLLGLAGTGAALAAVGWRPRGPSSQGRSSVPVALKSVNLIVSAALATLILWQLFLLLWIQKTLGAIVGLAVAAVVVAAGWRLRHRPRRLAISLATGLVLLQTALMVLATCPPGSHRTLVQSRGPWRKLTSRLVIWEGSVRLFRLHPLTGVGPSQFRKHYLAVRPVYSGIAAVGSHNWLLNMAAEWGVLGPLGVLIALGGCGWRIVRSLASPPDEVNPSMIAAMGSAIMVSLGCWLLVASDLPRSQWVEVLPYPMAVCLVTAAIVSLCRFYGTPGQVLLLAGMVGFVVHCLVEETANVAGVMWPFWAMVALAMAWKGQGSAASACGVPVRRLAIWTGPILAGMTALATVALTARPAYAVVLMRRAQQAVAAHRPVQAVELLWAAAAVDPLDPLPLTAAATLRYGLTQEDAPRAIEHLRDCIALSHAAVQRNVFDYEAWRSLGLAHMSLACAIEEYALVDEAIRDMRRALELNPQWPAGWLELARMAAVTGGRGERVDWLRTALEATDKALSIEGGRLDDAGPALPAKDRAALLELREQVLRRLGAAAAFSPATQPAP